MIKFGTIIIFLVMFVSSCQDLNYYTLDGDWQAVYFHGSNYENLERSPLINPHYGISSSTMPFISITEKEKIIEFPFGFNWQAIVLEDNFVKYDFGSNKLEVFYHDSSVVAYQTLFFSLDSFCLINIKSDTICFVRKHIDYNKDPYNIDFKISSEFISFKASVDSNGILIIKSIEDEFWIEVKLENSISQYLQRLIYRIDFDSVQYNEYDSKYISDVVLYDLDIMNLKEQHLFRNVTQEYANYHLRALIHNLEKLCKGILHKSKYKGHQIE